MEAENNLIDNIHFRRIRKSTTRKISNAFMLSK